MKVMFFSCPAVFAFLPCLLPMSKADLGEAENPEKTWRSVINCWTGGSVCIHTMRAYYSEVKVFDILTFP